MTNATIRRPGEGEPLINMLGAKVLIRITGRETNGCYAMIEAEQPPNSAPAPLHIHDREDEAIQVLEGRLIVEIDGQQHDAPAGTYIFIPRGVAQRFWNPDSSNCRYQSIFTPAGQEDYFRLAYLLTRSDPDYVNRLAEIRSRFGLRYPMQAGGNSG